MKKAMVLIFLVLLAACAAPQAPVEAPVVESEPEIVEEEAPEPTLIEINKTPEPVPEPVEEELGVVEALLYSIEQNITSYSFFSGKTQVFVLGDKMHILLDDFVELDFDTNGTRSFLTNAFLDLSTKTAVGYCDVRQEEEILGSFKADRSKCIKLINIPINVSFDDVYVKTPIDWLQEFKDTEPSIVETADQYVKQPTGWFTISPVLHYKLPEKSVIIRVDKKTKLPAKIEITKGQLIERIDYNWIIVNQVKPEEVTYQPFMPTRSSIS